MIGLSENGFAFRRGRNKEKQIVKRKLYNNSIYLRSFIKELQKMDNLCFNTAGTIHIILTPSPIVFLPNHRLSYHTPSN